MTTTRMKSICLRRDEVQSLLRDGEATLVRAVNYPTDEHDGVEECCYSGVGWAYTRVDGGCSCLPARCPFGRVGEQLIARTTSSHVEYDGGWAHDGLQFSCFVARTEVVAVRCERDAAGVLEWHGDVRRVEQ